MFHPNAMFRKLFRMLHPSPMRSSKCHLNQDALSAKNNNLSDAQCRQTQMSATAIASPVVWTGSQPKTARGLSGSQACASPCCSQDLSQDSCHPSNSWKRGSVEVQSRHRNSGRHCAAQPRRTSHKTCIRNYRCALRVNLGAVRCCSAHRWV
jgi:hypothetical protein